jgi:ABC-type multidrug transport system permease subunit
MLIVLKSGSLNLLEPSRAVQVYDGIAFTTATAAINATLYFFRCYYCYILSLLLLLLCTFAALTTAMHFL